MKEKLYTIPLNDAVNEHDECPFCTIERHLEQDVLDFVLGSGSSYMESDIREQTDTAGFCRTHLKKMFDYGNTLGNGWILKTHYALMNQELKKVCGGYKPQKTSFADKFKKNTERKNPIGVWAMEKEKSCYFCNRYHAEYERYLDTFFYLYAKDEAFRTKILESKGFCIPHFGDLCEAAEHAVKDNEKAGFYSAMSTLMEQNMERMYEDVTWLIEKFDYRNKDADWKSSKDAIQRGMQKLKGGYPADAPYQQSK